MTEKQYPTEPDGRRDHGDGREQRIDRRGRECLKRIPGGWCDRIDGHAGPCVPGAK